MVAALAKRGVQLLDAELAPPRTRVGVLAIVGAGGCAQLYISRNQQDEHAPSLEAITQAFQSLLDRGRYRHGALLVLGRDNLRNAAAPDSPYPALLHSLPAERIAAERSRRSARGIAGIRDTQDSAVTGLLWWELGRGHGLASSLRASYAFGRARIAFQHVEAASQAATAGAAARAAERAAQYDLFRPVKPPEPPRLRYEVMATTYLEASAETDEAWAIPRAGRSIGWRPLAEVDLDISALDQADFEQSPLAVRAFQFVPGADGSHRLCVAFDVAPRLALGAPEPAPQLRLRYGLFGSNVEVRPSHRIAPAGEMVEFEIVGEVDDDTELALTCTGSAEQSSTIRVIAEEGLRGRNDGLRLCWPD